VVEGCGGGQRSRAAARCPRSRTVRRRRIVHMPIACRARSFAAVSHLGRHDGRFAQSTQDHFLCPLGARGFDLALQRSQLCLAGVRVRNRRRHPLHQRLGRHGGLGYQPAFDYRPRIDERIHPIPPPMLGRGLLSMRWADLSILPRRRQALEEETNVRRSRRRRFGAYAVGCHVAQRLLSKPDLLQ
jgi:hypothetical protein